ncbi:hypothetical protein [Halomicrococcus gelatinilyticus]|uniref:hypothetical protein n=1 Tax=Halomicrococcus gelatinilyticus TaxID=1702103 RepID=UPI002E0F3CAF
MNSARAVLLATVVLCGTLLVAVPTAAGPTSSPSDANGDVRSVQSTVESVQANQTTNESLGAEISSFMQVSSAEAQGAVDTGMWVAEYNASGNQSAKQSLVDQQVTTLGRELDTLQREKQAIITAYRNGNITRVEYKAQMSSIIGRIQSVQQAINETEPRARAVGADVRAVTALSNRTNATVGPEVAAVAQSLNTVNVPNQSARAAGTTPPGQSGTPGASTGNGNTPGASAGNESNGPGAGTGNGNDGGNNNDVATGPANKAGVGNETDVSAGSGTDTAPDGGQTGGVDSGQDTTPSGGGGQANNPSLGDTGVLAPVETEIAP